MTEALYFRCQYNGKPTVVMYSTKKNFFVKFTTYLYLVKRVYNELRYLSLKILKFIIPHILPQR